MNAETLKVQFNYLFQSFCSRFARTLLGFDREGLEKILFPSNHACVGLLAFVPVCFVIRIKNNLNLTSIVEGNNFNWLVSSGSGGKKKFSAIVDTTFFYHTRYDFFQRFKWMQNFSNSPHWLSWKISFSSFLPIRERIFSIWLILVKWFIWKRNWKSEDFYELCNFAINNLNYQLNEARFERRSWLKTFSLR